MVIDVKEFHHVRQRGAARGRVVLDRGSGSGTDVLLSARRVGEAGLAYGADATDEMLEMARSNPAEANATNIGLLKGTIGDIPLLDGAVGVVILNSVINLPTDKLAVLDEVFRVLSPGGRIGVCDVVAEDHLSVAERAARGSYVGCIAGAPSRAEYLAGRATARFTEDEAELAHEAAPAMDAAITRAVEPLT